MIAIIDYEAGNIHSAARALAHFGAEHEVTADPERVRAAERVVIPGDGEARASMTSLHQLGLTEALREAAAGGTPILGICIGAQIVLDHSEERDVDCLGLIPGKTVRLPFENGLKVPHMGWNTLRIMNPHPITEGIEDDTAFYFVHSYVPSPSEAADGIATCEYGREFYAIVGRANVVATQFHPEKSGPAGLRLIRNFLDWTPEAD